jgi:hypothetical protein
MESSIFDDRLFLVSLLLVAEWELWVTEGLTSDVLTSLSRVRATDRRQSTPAVSHKKLGPTPVHFHDAITS